MGPPLALLNFRRWGALVGLRETAFCLISSWFSAERLKRPVDVRLLFHHSNRDSVTGRGLQATQPSQVHAAVCFAYNNRSTRSGEERPPSLHVRVNGMCYEGERLKKTPRRVLLYENSCNICIFSALGSAQTQMTSSIFLGGHWEWCNTHFFKLHRLILHLWRWINTLQKDKSLWVIMFPPVYNQVEWEGGASKTEGDWREKEKERDTAGLESRHSWMDKLT